MVGQRGIAELVAPHLHGVIDDLFLGAAAIGLQHLAGIGIGKDRLDPAGDIARHKADRPRGRDGGQQRVADAVFAPSRRCTSSSIRAMCPALQIGLGVEQAGRTPFRLRQLRRGQIRGAGDPAQPAVRLTRRLLRTIALAHHQQRIGQPGHPQPDPPLGLRLGLLFGSGKREASTTLSIIRTAVATSASSAASSIAASASNGADPPAAPG